MLFEYEEGGQYITLQSHCGSIAPWSKNLLLQVFFCHKIIVGHELLTNLHYILNPPHNRIMKSSLSIRAVGDAQKHFGCPCCAELRGGGGARLRPASDSAAAAFPPQSPQQRVSL